MKSLRYGPRHAMIAILFLLSMACSLTAPRLTPVTNTTDGQNPASSSGGEFNLTDPAARPLEQTRYRAWHQQDITGEIDGKTFERHTRTELTRDSDRVEFLQDIRSSDGPDAFSRVIQLENALYRWQTQDDSCQGMLGKTEPGEIVEPARYLLPVSGAVLVGQETINGISTAHYRYDQTGFAPSKAVSSAAGEMWLAEPGGYVVKYSLLVTGQGFEQNLSYEFTPLDAGENISLPAGCIEVPTYLPVLDDAQGLERSSGWVKYTTDTNALDAANYYLQKLPEQGWASMQQTLTAEPKLPFAASFTRADRHLSLTIDLGESSGLEVALFLTDIQFETAAVTDPETSSEQPEPAVDSAASGLLEDIPVYSDATGLIRMEGMVMFNVTDAPDTVAKFYRDQMISHGWSLQTDISSGGNIVQMWEKSGRGVMITLGMSDGVTFVVFTDQ